MAGDGGDGGRVGDDDFRAAFGEDLATLLDIETWDTGLGWERAVARLREAIVSAVGQEEHIRATIRAEILPRLGKRAGLPPEAGVYRATADQLMVVAEGLLFPGRVEAVDGIASSYDSLPIGITQLGIAVVGYGGTSGTFGQRLFRKEMSARGPDAYHEALDFIDQRLVRSDVGQKDHLSELARRGIRTYAERYILVDKSEAEWRIGRGNPFAHELLTGSGYMRLLEESLSVLRRLVAYKKFVFVSNSLRDRGLLTIGNALAAGEYAILDTLRKTSARIVEGWDYPGHYKDRATAFVEECCPEVLLGLFRASDRSPPYLFYAHREQVHMAALVALADSILRPERGFPLLIDVADTACRAAFGADGFLGLVHDAYTQAGANLQYFSERDKRR